MDFYKVTFTVGVPAEDGTEAVELAQQIIVLAPQMFLDEAEVVGVRSAPVAAVEPTSQVVARIVTMYHDGSDPFIPPVTGVHPKIKAIKDIKAALNIGLVEAKNLVNAEWERQR